MFPSKVKSLHLYRILIRQTFLKFKTCR